VSFNTISLFSKHYLAQRAQLDSLLYTQEYSKASRETLAFIPDMTVTQLSETAHWISSVAFLKLPFIETRHIMEVGRRADELADKLASSQGYRLLAETQEIGCSTPVLESVVHLSVITQPSSLQANDIASLLQVLSTLPYQVAKDISSICLSRLSKLDMRRLNRSELIELVRHINKVDQFDSEGIGEHSKQSLWLSLLTQMSSMNSAELLELLEIQARVIDLPKHHCMEIITKTTKSLATAPQNFSARFMIEFLDKLNNTSSKKLVYPSKEHVEAIGQAALHYLAEGKMTTAEAAGLINCFGILRIEPCSEVYSQLSEFGLEHSTSPKERLVFYANLWGYPDIQGSFFQTVGLNSASPSLRELQSPSTLRKARSLRRHEFPEVPGCDS
jgi:hypothetical protein